MRGTAPHMTIEENLALAYLRTAKHQRAFFSGSPRPTRRSSGSSSPGWTWAWRTGCASRWASSPAVSGRP